VCRAQVLGHPTGKTEGEGMCRYFAKAETVAITPTAHPARGGVTASKENISIVYGKARFGPTLKGGKGFLAERVFVEEDNVPLVRHEPDGVEMFIGHVSGAQGPRSTLTYYEYCQRPELTFTLASLQDCIKHDQWEAIFEQAEMNGLGSLRSQGHGRFTLLGVEQIAATKRPKFFTATKPGLTLVEDAAD